MGFPISKRFNNSLHQTLIFMNVQVDINGNLYIILFKYPKINLDNIIVIYFIFFLKNLSVAWLSQWGFFKVLSSIFEAIFFNISAFYFFPIMSVYSANFHFVKTKCINIFVIITLKNRCVSHNELIISRSKFHDILLSIFYFRILLFLLLG